MAIRTGWGGMGEEACGEEELEGFAGSRYKRVSKQDCGRKAQQGHFVNPVGSSEETEAREGGLALL